MAYFACVFLQRFGFGVIRINEEHGGRNKWSFVKRRFDLRTWARGPIAIGIAALGLHVGQEPSLRECYSIAMQSTLIDSDQLVGLLNPVDMNNYLLFLGLPDLAECKRIVAVEQEKCCAQPVDRSQAVMMRRLSSGTRVKPTDSTRGSDSHDNATKAGVPVGGPASSSSKVVDRTTAVLSRCVSGWTPATPTLTVRGDCPICVHMWF